ncbi:uncharacterized protein [Dysidea avara]|uniref:uncharacterized protein isoform X2 n=1 Tax=Dysidea avara TaxID=196820 RepID=UPI0033333B20
MANNSVSEGLDQFKSSDKATSTPLLKDLQNHITHCYAVYWRVIGTQLDLPNETLNIIEHSTDMDGVPACCNAMLEKWLEVDPSASWEKLFKVIESLAVSTTNQADQGANAVTILSERMSQMNIQAQFSVDEDVWPPTKPKKFIPLLLVHCRVPPSVVDLKAMKLLLQLNN